LNEVSHSFFLSPKFPTTQTNPKQENDGASGRNAGEQHTARPQRCPSKTEQEAHAVARAGPFLLPPGSSPVSACRSPRGSIALTAGSINPTPTPLTRRVPWSTRHRTGRYTCTALRRVHIPSLLHLTTLHLRRTQVCYCAVACSCLCIVRTPHRVESAPSPVNLT
jgi:hypothetical protein